MNIEILIFVLLCSVIAAQGVALFQSHRRVCKLVDQCAVNRLKFLQVGKRMDHLRQHNAALLRELNAPE